MTLLGSTTFIQTHADWRFSYLLNHCLYTWLTTVSSVFRDLGKEHTTSVWLVDRGCLLLLGTWSHLQYNGGPCLLKVWLMTVTNYHRFVVFPDYDITPIMMLISIMTCLIVTRSTQLVRPINRGPFLRHKDILKNGQDHLKTHSDWKLIHGVN